MADQGQSADLLWSSDITLVLLGSVRLGNSAGDDFTPRARKTRALLAILALGKGPVTRSRLTELLWGDRGEEQAKASLRQALYELRDLASGGYLSADRESVTLGPKKLASDLDMLKRTIEDRDVAALADALQLVDTPLLATLDDITTELDEWLRDERTRIVRAIAGKSIDLADQSVREGRADTARRIADQLERLDPLDERIAQLGIRADLADGDRSAASRRRGRFAQRLKEQLGLEISPETEALLRECSHVAAPAPEQPITPPANEQREPRPKRSLIAAGAALLLLLAAGLAYFALRSPAGAATPTVAVLPFDDLGQKNEDYFASGVSDDILNLLAHQGAMKVLGRVSAEQLAGGPNSLSTARELGVSYLLDGSVRTASDRVLVIARLTRVSDGAQVWSERYERRIGDIFAVQGDIASAVAARVAQSFAPTKPQGTTPEVYDRYLAAKQLVRDRRDVTLKEADRLLREAIALDPHYAPAFAELAQTIMLEADHPTAYGSLPIVEARAQAQAFALKAHRLDPNLGDAYASLGFLSLSLAPQAEPYFRKAVQLSPQTPEFHRWHGETLLNERRYDQAIAEFKRAVEIDPLWGLSYDHLIGALYLLGRKDEAHRYLNHFLSLSTDQRAKLLLLRSMADNDSRVADEFRISLQLFRAYPQERQVRFGFASILAELGERRRALDLMKDDRIAAAALSSDWPALAAAASSLGSEYWNVSKFWNADNLLVQSRHGETIVRMYDRDRGLVASGQVNGQDMATPSTVLALRQMGRNADASRLIAQMESLNSARPHGGLLGDDRLMNGIMIAALRGDRETAIRGLDDLSRRNPLMLTYIPAQALRYDPTFTPLASDPRFPAIEDRVRVATNSVRQSFGMAPISRAAWISDPRALLTKN